MLRSGLPGRRDASVQHEFYRLDGVPLLLAHGRHLHAPEKLSRKWELRGHEAGDTAHNRLGALRTCDL